jgi:hypothetical protein
MEIKKEKVTPSIAKQWLATNIESNRRVRQERVDFYAAEMLQGRWVENSGETIKFDRSGKLNDGQHRLHAVVKANKTVWFSVARNVDPQAFAVIDSGMARNGGDVLHISGIPNANVLAAGIKVYHGLMNGILDPDKSGVRLQLSNRLLLDMYNQDAEYWQTWVRKSAKWYAGFSKIVAHSFIIGFSVVLDKNSKKRDKIDAFFDELCMDMAFDPSVRLLRKRLIEDKMKRNEKLTAAYKTIYFIKVWNAFVTGKELKKLSYDPDVEQSPKLM